MTRSKTALITKWSQLISPTAKHTKITILCIKEINITIFGKNHPIKDHSDPNLTAPNSDWEFDLAKLTYGENSSRVILPVAEKKQAGTKKKRDQNIISVIRSSSKQNRSPAKGTARRNIRRRTDSPKWKRRAVPKSQRYGLTPEPRSTARPKLNRNLMEEILHKSGSRKNISIAARRHHDTRSAPHSLTAPSRRAKHGAAEGGNI